MIPKHNKTENQLLRLCCRVDIGADSAAQIALLAKEELDWEFVLRFAHYHKVVPLVHRSLKAYGCAPGFVMERLHKTLSLNTINLLSRVGALTRIVTAMRVAGIDTLPYKGPVLASVAYGDMSLRMCGDLDLMVRSVDVDAAFDVLTGLGYRPYKEADAITDAEETEEGGPLADPGALDYHRAFVSEDGSTFVEVHWHFRPKYVPMSLNIDQLWEQLVPVSFAGISVPSLPAESHIVLLCAHGTKHRWSRLMWLCDITELIRKHADLDWQKVNDIAAAMGMKRNLAVGLWLAHSVLDAPIPQDVLASCPWLLRSIANTVAGDTLEHVRMHPGRAAMAIYNLVVVERQDTRFAAIRARVSGR